MTDAGGSPRRSRRALLRGLHVLADDDPRWKSDPVEQAEAACRGGAAVVQLRAKLAPDRVTLAWAERIRALTLESGLLFFVNDRFDLALAAEADGVHLGLEDIPPARVPGWARERLWIGRSSHTVEQARSAAMGPVDYVAFGPVYGTTSKATPWEARGAAALAAAVRAVAPRPLVAIGGIDAARAAEVARAGAGAAVISAVAGEDDPESAVRRLVAAFESGR